MELTIIIAKNFSKKPCEKKINTNYPIWRKKKKETENKETNKNRRTLRTCGTETKRNLILITYVNRISQTKETNGRAKCVFFKIMAKTFPTLAKKKKNKTNSQDSD